MGWLFFMSLSSSSGGPATRAGRQQSVRRSCSGAANHQERRNRQREQVVLITLAFLCSGPVHKEAELTMHHHDSHDHVHKDSKGRYAGERSEDQAQSAEKLRRNRQKREHHRNVHDSGKEAHRAAESVSAEPSEHLLGAVREKDQSEHQSKNGCGKVVVRADQFPNHENVLRRNRCPEWGQPPDKIIYPYIRILFIEIKLATGEDYLKYRYGRGSVRIKRQPNKDQRVDRPA